ncbi:hypothetical protein PsYK624_138560 [Phanerochaete sordida]|uniref:F-box domain-containing protein n=1 Tax=Phanerochaete sordida TaxID=48140 RepID=A0A9P3GQE2_9APHY|nr:hypothetical protein PsYK624_138560 [Phanerochaete sordida]
MHRALQITEILTMILRAIDPRYQRRVAAAMAATCRTFSETANDVVWEDLQSPRPLLRCLPDEVSSRSRTLEECARFLTHAARVRTLQLQEEDADDIQDHLATLLAIRSCGTTTLLPGLRDIVVESDFVSESDHIEPSETSNALYLYLFLSPTLRTAQLETWGIESLQLIHQVATFCPQLQYLGVNRFPERAGLVRCFNTLEDFSACEGSIDAAVLDEMAYLPSLRVFRVAIPDDFSHIERHWPQDRLFTALQSLYLNGPSDPRHVAKFLRSVNSKQLHTLSLYLSECQTDDVLKVLDAASKFTTLRSLEVQVHSHQTEFHSSFPPQAILKLHHLETLEFTLGGMPVTSHSAQVLGRACPKLRDLKVKHDRDHYWPLDVLESFAVHLPSLETLNTELNTELASTLDEPKARSQAPICLKLDGADLSEEHWKPTAAYIARVYPNATFKSGSLWADGPDEMLKRYNRGQLYWRYVGRAVAKARSDTS